jgi:uncharacterized protein (TIGR03067 family)
MHQQGTVMTRRIGCLLLVGLLLGADQPTDAAKKDLEKFQGEWKPEKAQRDGVDAGGDLLNKLLVKYSGETMVIDSGGARDDKATITLDPSKNPAAIDIKPVGEGKDTALGIYKLDGDTLTLCWSRRGGERPTEFVSKAGTEQVLFILKRQKKK